MKHLSDAETAAVVDEIDRLETAGPGFGFADPFAHVRYSQHVHRRHQLIVPREGYTAVEAEQRLFLAGPGQAIWIPARCRHATTIRASHVTSVFFDPRAFDAIAPRPCLFSVPDVVGAMVEHAATLPPAPSAGNQAFFEALRTLCVSAIAQGGDGSLPRPTSPSLLRAVHSVEADLPSASIDSMSRAAGMSERTLRRAFRAETGMSPRAYLERIRMLFALHELSQRPPRTVLDVALATGFASPSAFGAAFRRHFGVAPSEARARSVGRR